MTITRIPALERRSSLVDAALRVVAERGVAQATTRAIVAEAGMSLASFHYAFASRDELMAELIRRVVAQEGAAILPDPAEQTGPAPLRRILREDQGCLTVSDCDSSRLQDGNGRSAFSLFALRLSHRARHQRLQFPGHGQGGTTRPLLHSTARRPVQSIGTFATRGSR